MDTSPPMTPPTFAHSRLLLVIRWSANGALVQIITRQYLPLEDTPQKHQGMLYIDMKHNSFTTKPLMTCELDYVVFVGRKC